MYHANTPSKEEMSVTLGSPINELIPYIPQHFPSHVRHEEKLKEFLADARKLHHGLYTDASLRMFNMHTPSPMYCAD